MTAPTAGNEPFVDYYALFGIAPDADPDTVRKAVDMFLRTWQKRRGSRKKEVRHEAEDKLEQAARGEEVLLDPVERAAYDARWAARGSTAAVPDTPDTASGPTAGAESLRRAVEALEAGDHKAARFFAARATEQSDAPEAWFALFAACSELGDNDGAEIAGTTAVRMSPDNHEWVRAVAVHFAVAGDPERAESLLEQAVRTDPSPRSGLVLANLYSALGNPKPMLTLMRGLHKRFPDDPDVTDTLGEALRHQAVSIPELSTQYEYAITTHAEASRMRTLVDEAKKLRIKTATRQRLRELERILEQAEEKAFTFRLFSSEGLSWTCWLLGLLCLPIGLAVMFSGFGFGFVMVLVGGTGMWNILTRCNPPGYELNARQRFERESAMRQRAFLRDQMS